MVILILLFDTFRVGVTAEHSLDIDSFLISWRLCRVYEAENKQSNQITR